jgi:hypothetical protein
LSQAQQRVAAGIAFADIASARVMAHELSHTFGRSHAPCNASAPIDAGFPYVDAKIGAWGFDRRTQTFFDPANTHDFLSSCSPIWISDYTYQAIVDRLAAVNGH